MSSSVFKEYPSSHATDDGESKLESNLVVFINKKGGVSVDQSALQDLLGKYYALRPLPPSYYVKYALTFP